MKQLNNSAAFSLVFCLLVTIFIVFGVNKAFADPQPLPFSFFPGIGNVEWQGIDNDGGDLGTGSPFSGSCSGAGGTGLNISDGDNVGPNDDDDAYDGAWLTTVNTSFVGTDGIGDLTGSTYTAVAQNISELDVTYQLFFSLDTLCNRFILFLDNPTGSDIQETIRTATNFGSDGNTQLDGTSSGDLIFTTADRWIVTSDGEPLGDPVNTTVYYGPGSPEVTPNFVTSDLQACGGFGGAGAQYEITVPAGETRCLMFFACMGDITQNFNTIAGALAAAPLFDSNDTIPGDLLGDERLGSQFSECVVNWDFPEPEEVIVPTLSEWGLIAMAGILGIVGFMVIRRRKAVA